MRSLNVLLLMCVLGCGDKSHEIAVPVPGGTVPGGATQIVNATNIPCGIGLQFEFVDRRLVRVVVVNSNTVPVKVVLRNQRTGVEIIICADSQSTKDQAVSGGGTFGQMGDQFGGDVSLQSVPGAHFLCLSGRTDGFDVCSSLTITLTP